MAITQLKLLINLARIDGEVADKEVKYITNIGLANGVVADDIGPLFKQDHDVIIPEHLTEKEKFDVIVSLVQLMKIDERLYKDEIRYCAMIASRLGYDQSVMFDLMLHVKGVMEANEQDALRSLTAKYLRSQ